MCKNREIYQNCTLCPRRCGADRSRGQGFCRGGTVPLIARAALHKWEEPCISGNTGDEEHAPGSGAVFFSHCTLGCIYCQNYEISAEGKGREVTPERLAEIYLRLQDEGAANIDLITAAHYLPDVLRSLDLAKPRLTVPVVWNSGGYERLETLRALEGYVDIYLPDIKYYAPELSEKYSMAPDYYEYAVRAAAEMIRQTGAPDIDKATGLMRRGTIVRHMVLPGCRKDSIEVLRHIRAALPEGQFLISLMSQYTPFYKAKELKELNRRLTGFEYDSVLREALALGLDGYMQERSSAAEEYTPAFDFEGV